MSNKKHLPPAKLNPEIYKAWLNEPKEVLGGTLKLIRNPNSNNEDDVNLEAYQMNSEELPEYYVKDLVIFGYYNEFVGFKIWVSVDKYCYLLMAHQTHSEKGFISADGREFKNHPHFHEIDFDSPLIQREKQKPCDVSTHHYTQGLIQQNF